VGDTVTVGGKRYRERLLIDKRDGLLGGEFGHAYYDLVVKARIPTDDLGSVIGPLTDLENHLRDEFYAAFAMIMFLINAFDDSDDDARGELKAAAGKYLKGFPHFGKWFNELESD
jgi:hypothetical protein